MEAIVSASLSANVRKTFVVVTPMRNVRKFDVCNAEKSALNANVKPDVSANKKFKRFLFFKCKFKY